MTLYGDFLQLALQDESRGPEQSVAELVKRAAAHRLALCPPAGRLSPGWSTGAGARLADALAYDVALIRLSRRLDVEHGFEAPTPPEGARRLTEERIIEKLIELGADGSEL